MDAFGTSVSAAVALSTRCDRAGSWRSEAVERRLPCFQVPAASLPTLPSIVSDRLSLPYDEESRSAPGELTASCETDFLPGSRGLPVLTHQCAWLAQDARASGTSCVDFAIHFEALLPLRRRFPRPNSRYRQLNVMKHRAKFTELDTVRILLQGFEHPGDIATAGSISNLISFGLSPI